MKNYIIGGCLAAAIAAIGASHAMAYELGGNTPPKSTDNIYKQITIDDFLLDGKTLAADNQKVSLTGTYIHDGKSDWLYPAKMWARNRDESNGVPFIKDGATREFRLLLMSTWSRTNSERGVQGIVILGHVSMCERTTLAGVEQMPCVIVEDGNNQPAVEAAARQAEFSRQAAIEREQAEKQAADAHEQAMSNCEATRPAREAAQAAHRAAESDAAIAHSRRSHAEQVAHMGDVGDSSPAVIPTQEQIECMQYDSARRNALGIFP